MSTKAVSSVVARAVTDVDFRERLSERPDELLAPYRLLPAETEALKELVNKPVLEEFAQNLTTRSYIKKDAWTLI